jgi:AcrR family transcriptional regulator
MIVVRERTSMPTGVAIRDVRDQLFAAAERVLLRAGPSALTSRAVTNEAGVAKGVLHRHFADFDAFLVELVLDRTARLKAELGAMTAGTGTVAGNLTEALTSVFESVAVAIVSLITFRETLRARLREVLPPGVPILTDAVQTIAAYLRAERDLGRVAADADVDAVALALIGTAHMLFAGGEDTRPEAVHRMVRTVIAGSL